MNWLPESKNDVDFAKDFWAISYLFSPLLIGLTIHGLCIKFGWLSFLIHPIDSEKNFRGKRIFGANKTYRGIFAVALGTALGFAFQAFVLHRFEFFRQLELLDYSSAKVIFIGFLIGAAAMLGELPNSFIKRQVDIAPGAATGGFLSVIFYIFDQIDYLSGTWIVLAFFIRVSIWRVFYSAIFLFISHQIISALGYRLGMRKTAR